MGKNDLAVAVLGASPKPERYSNKAVKLLSELGYNVLPVNPSGAEMHGLVSRKKLEDIKEPVHTLSLYVNPELSTKLKESILLLNPGRVIFNPGTENPELEKACRAKGIETVEACTLVMLKTDQF
jgi:predicted CoA-binding protein